MARDELHDHDRGLTFDMSTLVARRRMLGWFAGAGVATLVGCASTDDGASGTAPTSSPTASTTGGSNPTADSTANCDPIPEETAGPYPGDGSNGPNALTRSGIVRRDIRSSFGNSTTVAAGVPLSITLTILNINEGCGPYPGAAVYLWHCDIDGNYSLYSQAAANENYLRGVQVADTAGRVSFTSIFPACYSGRWPHIHYEVYPNLSTATSSGSRLATSQIALPPDACHAVYATSGYEQSVRNLARTSLATDNVFSDGWSRELGAMGGDVSSGYTCTIDVPV